MSRSYKRTPILKHDHRSHRKVYKKIANKKVRCYHQILANGKQYRKIFDSYEIYEYISYKTLKDAIIENEIYKYHKDLYDTEEKVVEGWKRAYHRK